MISSLRFTSFIVAFLIYLVNCTQASNQVSSVAFSATKKSAIEGLLSSNGTVVRRQFGECPFAGGIDCDAETCCPANTFCQPNNRELPGEACCHDNDLDCNGGTACCPSDSRCCTESSTGCCVINAGYRRYHYDSVFLTGVVVILSSSIVLVF